MGADIFARFVVVVGLRGVADGAWGHAPDEAAGDGAVEGGEV